MKITEKHSGFVGNRFVGVGRECKQSDQLGNYCESPEEKWQNKEMAVTKE